MLNKIFNVYILTGLFLLLTGQRCYARDPTAEETTDFIVEALLTCEDIISATKISSEITVVHLFEASERDPERRFVQKFDLRNIRSADESKDFRQYVPGKGYLYIACEQPNCFVWSDGSVSNRGYFRCKDMNIRLANAMTSYVRRFGKKKPF